MKYKKKGSVLDLFWIVIGFFTVVVIGILMSSVVTRFDSEFQGINNPEIMTASTKQVSTDLSGVLPATLNGGLLFLFFGACLVALVLAAMTYVHPIFFLFFILELSILILFSGGISNAFQTFIESPIMATEHTQYPTLIFIFRWLPFIIGVIGLLMAAIMYKVRQQQ